MAQESMQAAILRQHEKVNALGKALRKDFSEVAIHDFRVEVKKLRALLRMGASAHHASIKPNLPQKVKTFYAMAGVVRKLQLQRTGLVDVARRLGEELPASCLAAVDSRIESAKMIAHLYLRGKRPFGKERRQWLTPISAHTASLAGQDFLRIKQKELSAPVRAGMAETEALHTRRKAMKDLLYVWPWLSKTAICKAQSAGTMSKELLHSRTGLLGDHRDVMLRLSLLQDKHFLSCSGPQADKFLELAGQIWTQDKQLLSGRIKNISVTALPAEHSLLPSGNPLAPINLKAASYELHID